VTPHPLGSLTSTGWAFSTLHHALQYLCARQQAWKQQQADQQRRRRCSSDSRQGRDTDTAPAAGVGAALAALQPSPAKGTQQQLLCLLYACTAAAWQALASNGSDLGLAGHVLQNHAAARRCMPLLQRYCRAAGLVTELQQQLLALLQQGAAEVLAPSKPAQAGKAGKHVSGGLVLVKQEPHSSQDAAGAAAQQQPDGPVLLLQSLKSLMGCSKAHAAAAKRQQPGGGGGSGGTPAAAAALSSNAQELSVAGVQTWALIPPVLGPAMLDKAVGQPLLDVSEADVPCRLACAVAAIIGPPADLCAAVCPCCCPCCCRSC
jgi:hypothetical protein